MQYCVAMAGISTVSGWVVEWVSGIICTGVQRESRDEGIPVTTALLLFRSAIGTGGGKPSSAKFVTALGPRMRRAAES